MSATDRTPHHPSPSLWSPVALLAFACLFAMGCKPSLVEIADKPYVPFYAAGVGPPRPEAKGTIAYDFAQAASSKTLKEAVTNWERFLKERTPPDGELEDSSQKRYLDVAHYELMRVYYLLNRQEDGDRLLHKLDPLQLK